MIDRDYLLEAFNTSQNPCILVLPDSPHFTIAAVSKAFLACISTPGIDILHKRATLLYQLPTYLDPDGIPRLIQTFKDVVISRESQFLDTTCYTHHIKQIPYNQKARWEGNSMPIFDNKGEIRYILYSAIATPAEKDKKDIASSLQQANINSAQDTTTILENMGEAFYRIDSNSIVTYWNNQAEIILKQPREKILNKNLWDVYGDVVDTIFYTNVQKVLKENTIVRFEAFYDTLELWLEVHVFPSGDGGCSVYFKDVTERKRSVDQLRDSEEKNRLIMNAALDAIICMDKKGNITFWNPKAQALFGWESTEVIGNKLSTFIIPQKFRHHHDAGLENYLKTGESRALNRLLELDGLRRNGEEFPIELTVIPITQPGEAFFCAFIRDISARKKAEASINKQALDLEISNRELEQFAYVASHDLQEPLRMVTSFLKQLENKYSDIIDERGKQYIFFAVDGAKRMRQIILDLLEFSRVGRWDEKVELVDIGLIVDESLKLFANQILETGTLINIHPLPSILINQTPIIQVFQNLIANALKYRNADTSPEIEISAKESDSEWEFLVKDNGIGISPQYHEKIFVIFQRLHNRDEYSGTGIGLAVVKKIIINLGGKIWVNSQEGKGAEFRFTIPKS